MRLACLLLAALACCCALWAVADEVESTLVLRTNVGFKEAQKLVIKDGKAYLNGFMIQTPNGADPGHDAALATLLSLANKRGRTSWPQCPAGEFIHEVKTGSKPLRENGCLNDPRFHELMRAFENLRRGVR